MDSQDKGLEDQNFNPEFNSVYNISSVYLPFLYLFPQL